MKIFTATVIVAVVISLAQLNGEERKAGERKQPSDDKTEGETKVLTRPPPPEDKKEGETKVLTRPPPPEDKKEGETKVLTRPPPPEDKKEGETKVLTRPPPPEDKKEGETKVLTRPPPPEDKKEGETKVLTRPPPPKDKKEGETKVLTRPPPPEDKKEGKTKNNTRPQLPEDKKEGKTKDNTRPQLPEDKIEGKTKNNTRPQLPEDKKEGKTKDNTRPQLPEDKTTIEVTVALSNKVNLLYEIQKEAMDQKIELDRRDIELVKPASFKELVDFECVPSKEKSGPLDCILKAKLSEDACQFKKQYLEIRFGEKLVKINAVSNIRKLPAPSRLPKMNIEVPEYRKTKVEVANTTKELGLDTTFKAPTCNVPEADQTFIEKKFRQCEKLGIAVCTKAGKHTFIKKGEKEIPLPFCEKRDILTITETDQLLFRPEKNMKGTFSTYFKFVCASEEQTILPDKKENLKKRLASMSGGLKEAAINPILAEISSVDFIIKNINDKPVVNLINEIIAPYVPYDLKMNRGITVGALIQGKYIIIENGYSVKDKRRTKEGTKSISDADDEDLKNVGIAIIGMKASKNTGHFSFLNHKAKVEEKITLEEGKAFLLGSQDILKFVPVDKETMWTDKQVTLKIRAWDKTDKSESGMLQQIDLASDAFSDEVIEVTFVREGCEGVIGECNRKCAAADQKLVCEECIGGTTGKVEADVKMCGVCKNYETLAQRFIKKVTIAKEQVKTREDQDKPKEDQTKPKEDQSKPKEDQVKPDDTQAKPKEEQAKPKEKRVKREDIQVKPEVEAESSCGDDKCSKISQKLCGKCVSELPEKLALVQCGKCLTDGAARSDCLMHKDLESQIPAQISVCGVQREKIDKKLCKITTEEGEDTECGFQRKPVRSCKTSIEEELSKRSCHQLYLNEMCKAGTYKITCSTAFSQSFTVKEEKKIALTLDKTEFIIGKNNGFVVKSADIVKDTKYQCCVSSVGMKMADCRSPMEVTADGEGVCKVLIRSEGAKLFIKNCAGKNSEEVELKKNCGVEPSVAKSKIVFIKGVKKIILGFDLPISFDKTCVTAGIIHDRKSVLKIDFELLKDAKVALPNKCFKHCETTGETSVPISSECPKAVAAAVIKELQPYKPLRLNTKFARKVGKLIWTAIPSDPQKISEDNLNAAIKKLAETDRGKLWLRQDESWAIEGLTYTFKACGTNDFDVVCCREFTVKVPIKKKSDIKVTLRPFATRNIVRASAKLYNGTNKQGKKLPVTWAITDKDGNNISVKDAEARVQKLAKYISSENRNLTLTATAVENGLSGSASHTVELEGKTTSIRIRNSDVCLPCDGKLVLNAKIINAIEDANTRWKCSTEDNSNCFSGATKNPVLNKTKLELEVAKDYLFCDQTYNFKAFYNGFIQSQEVKVKLSESGCEPKIRCKSKKPRKEDKHYTIECNIENVANDSITFQANENTVFDKDVVPTLKDMPKKKIVRMIAKIAEEDVSPGQVYGFDVIAENDDGIATKTVEFKSPGEITNCECRLSESVEVDKDTPVSIYMTGCEASDSPIKYKILTLIKEEKPRTLIDWQTSEEDFEDTIGTFLPLPNDGVHKFRCMAQTADGASFTQDLELKVKYELIDVKDQLESDGDKIKKLVEAGDEDAAKSGIGKLNDLVKRNKEAATTDAEIKEAIENEKEMVEDAIGILSALDIDDTYGQVLSSVGDGVEEVTENTKKILKGLNLGKRNDEVSEEGKSRKRRSIDDSEEDLLTSDLISGYLTSQQMQMFPINYDNDSREAKSNFHDYLPTVKRSIAKHLGEEDESLHNKTNMILHAHRFTEIDTTVSTTTAWGTEVKFTETVKTNYDYWNCSQYLDTCNGFVMVTSEIDGDLRSDGEDSEKVLVSNVVSMQFINPWSEGTYELIDTALIAPSVTIPLKGGDTELVYCHAWDAEQQDWKVDGCFTMNMTAAIKCQCGGLISQHIALFKITEVAAIEVEEVIAAQTTPAPATTAASTDDSTMANAESTPQVATNDGGSTNAPDVTGGSQQTSSGNNNNPNTQSSQTTSGPLQIKPLQYSIDADYDTLVASEGKENLRQQICDQTRVELNVDSNQVSTCTISKGSIIVNITLIMDEESLQQTVLILHTKVESNELKIEINNVPLNMQSGSVYMDNVNYPAPKPVEEEDDNDSTLTIVVAVIVSIVIIAFVIIVVVVIIKGKNSSKTKVDPDYKQMKGGSPRTGAGLENPTYTGHQA